jgi:hypothetical protein
MRYLEKSEYTFKALFYCSPSVVNKRGVFGLLDHIRRDLKEVGLRGNVALSAQNKVTLISLMTAEGYPHNVLPAVNRTAVPPPPVKSHDDSDQTPRGDVRENIIAPPPLLPTEGEGEEEYKGKQLVELLRSLQGGASPLDEERVREIIREESPSKRVVVSTPHRADFDAGLQHRQFSELVTYVASGVNVWVTGTAGAGKTTAVKNVAKALGLKYFFNGAIDSEHKVLGFIDAQGRIISRPFRQAWEFGGVYLFDEIDGSNPSALLAFNAALANGECDFPDGCIPKHKDFRAIACANTFGGGASADYVGRLRQDGAFLDRWVFIDWEIDSTLEEQIALSNIVDQAIGGEWIKLVRKCRASAHRHGVKVIISPRASIFGCTLLQAGVAWDSVVASALKKGIDSQTWLKISQ